MIQTIPTYFIDLIKVEQSGSTRYKIIQKTLKPTATLPSFILDCLNALSDSYVRLLDKPFDGSMKAKLSFTLGKGLTVEVCSDEKIKEVANGIVGWVDFPREPDLDYSHFKQVKLAEEDKQALKEEANADQFVFLDAITAGLIEEEICEPIVVNLEFNPIVNLGGGRGLTTGILRFPHLLLHLFERFKSKPAEKICLVGPGLFLEESLLICPQFVEIFSLSPSSRFVILDNEKDVLKLLEEQFHGTQAACYDPYMLKQYYFKKKREVNFPEKYTPLFAHLRKTLGEMASFPKNATQILKKADYTTPVTLKLDPKKVEIREFDILTTDSKKEEKGTFDIVIATHSMLWAFQQQLRSKPDSNIFSILKKFLELLKENGTLFTDSLLFQELLEKRFGTEAMKVAINYIEILLGNKLKLEEIPLSDFLPGTLGNQGTLYSITTNQAHKDMKMHVSTCSITMITKTAEKVEVSHDEKVKVIQQVVEMLTKQKS